MTIMAMVAGAIWGPALALGGTAWLASRVSVGARRWIGRQLFG